MSTIATDVHSTDTPAPLTQDGAFDAFLKLDADASGPSDRDEENTAPDVATDDPDAEIGDDAEYEDAEQTDDEDGTDEDDEGSDDESKPSKVDDQEIEVKVGDDVHKVKVGDLKRLYGQEAALTKRSQEVAEVRKRVDSLRSQIETDGAKHAAALDRLAKKTEAKWSQYADVDWHTLSLQMVDNPQGFSALRQEAAEAYKDYSYMHGELDQFVSGMEQERRQRQHQQAQEALKVLTKEIKGFNATRYEEITSYAVEQGLDPHLVSNITDPYALILIEKSRKYDAMISKSKTKQNDVKKKVASPSRVLKPEVGAASIENSGNRQHKKAIENLRKSGGSKDAAFEAFKALR